MSIYSALETTTVETILTIPVDLMGSGALAGAATLQNTTTAAANGTFDIVIRYHGDPQYQAAFTSAAARWSQIIIGDITDIFVNNSQYSLNQTIDDLLIDALETTNGGIHARLPRAFAARVDAANTNGSIETNLPILVTGSQSKHSLHGTINGGGPELRLRTTNGSIHINSI